MKKIYLGDSVYGEYDGYGTILTTENGYGPTNKIYLEPQVQDALEAYWAEIKRKTDERRWPIHP